MQPPAAPPPPTPPIPAQQTLTTLLKRSLRVDMGPGELLPDEKIAFDVEHIHRHSPLLLQLLAWRRAALLLAFVLAIAPVAFNFIKAIVAATDAETHATVGGLGFLVSLSGLIAFAGLWFAYRRWDDWARSRRILFATWLVGFATPFLVALYPVRALGGAFGFGNADVLLGMVGALSAIIDLAPRALALVPGMIRAGLMSKALLPANRFGPWIVQLGAPLYMFLLIVVLLVPYQLAGGGLMAPALFALLAGPIFVWRAGRRLMSQSKPDDIYATLRTTRVSSLVFNTIGAIFVFIGLIDALGELKMSWTDAILPIIGLVANIFVVTVLCLDLLMHALVRHHVQAADERGDETAIDLFIAAVAPPAVAEPTVKDPP
jgi:hypothetical protein